GTVAGFVPIPALVSAWVGFNHCNPTPVVTQVPDTNTGDGCTAEHSVYTGGDLGSTVEHYKIIGGGHTWPGAAFIIGVTNQDINASREIWRFFRKDRLDQLTATRETPAEAAHWSAFPNPAGDYFYLQNSSAELPATRIQVFDALGQLVRSIVPVPGQLPLRLETAGWADGVYTLLIESKAGRERLQLLKKTP
ncbi:MAG: T9SS type A sorting domain-containing protein, partial [Saprospiraceae bacterium]